MGAAFWDASPSVPSDWNMMANKLWANFHGVRVDRKQSADRQNARTSNANGRTKSSAKHNSDQPIIIGRKAPRFLKSLATAPAFQVGQS